jgi:hypothetical protein
MRATRLTPILAALTDAATAQAASANPDSTLARLANQNTLNEANLNKGLNASNLFYSSERGNDLGTLANNYRSSQNDAASALAGLLGQANQSVLDAQNQSQNSYLNALQGAWDRWLALQQLLGSGSGSGGGGFVPSQTITTDADGTVNIHPTGPLAPTTYVPSTTAQGKVRTASGYGF